MVRQTGWAWGVALLLGGLLGGAAPGVAWAGCGDGNLESGEECDDGNTTACDGCSTSCTRECGFTCHLDESYVVIGSTVTVNGYVENTSCAECFYSEFVGSTSPDLTFVTGTQGNGMLAGGQRHEFTATFQSQTGMSGATYPTVWLMNDGEAYCEYLQAKVCPVPTDEYTYTNAMGWGAQFLIYNYMQSLLPQSSSFYDSNEVRRRVRERILPGQSTDQCHANYYQASGVSHYSPRVVPANNGSEWYVALAVLPNGFAPDAIGQFDVGAYSLVPFYQGDVARMNCADQSFIAGPDGQIGTQDDLPIPLPGCRLERTQYMDIYCKNPLPWYWKWIQYDEHPMGDTITGTGFEPYRDDVPHTKAWSGAGCTP